MKLQHVVLATAFVIAPAVAFADEIFTRVEDILGLAPNTLKMGTMDAERRPTLNLQEATRPARTPGALITPGLPARPRPELHSSLDPRPMPR